jgi:uncharacterized protein YdhG (YjbR/CyaY superfamily)
MRKPKDIDEYISSYPREIQKLLEQFRATIRKAAPEAEEVISYGMPAFKLKGMLVWFAAHSRHIGFYPRVSAIEAFRKELSIYKGAKGSVQFPLGKPLPLGIVSKIVKFRVKENLEKAKRSRSQNKKIETQ